MGVISAAGAAEEKFIGHYSAKARRRWKIVRFP